MDLVDTFQHSTTAGETAEEGWLGAMDTIGYSKLEANLFCCEPFVSLSMNRAEPTMVPMGRYLGILRVRVTICGHCNHNSGLCESMYNKGYNHMNVLKMSERTVAAISYHLSNI